MSYCILPAVLKNPTMLNEIVNFLKIDVELGPTLGKRLQKNNKDAISENISRTIYQLHFQKFCPLQKR